MSQHTPTPWTVEYDNSDESDGGQWFNIGPATVWYSYRSPPEVEARAKTDAEFIARACNAHYDLLAACKAVLNAYLTEASWGDGVHEDFGPVIEQAKAAIARAEGTA